MTVFDRPRTRERAAGRCLTNCHWPGVPLVLFETTRSKSVIGNLTPLKRRAEMCRRLAVFVRHALQACPRCGHLRPLSASGRQPRVEPNLMVSNRRGEPDITMESRFSADLQPAARRWLRRGPKYQVIVSSRLTWAALNRAGRPPCPSVSAATASARGRGGCLLMWRRSSGGVGLPSLRRRRASATPSMRVPTAISLVPARVDDLLRDRQAFLELVERALAITQRHGR